MTMPEDSSIDKTTLETLRLDAEERFPGAAGLMRLHVKNTLPAQEQRES